MPEIALKKRFKYAGDVFAALMKKGWSCTEAADFVNSFRDADAVEVVHGHWCWEGKFKACSRCGSYVEWDETLGASFWKFCPYCGAKMDGERKDDEDNT